MVSRQPPREAIPGSRTLWIVLATIAAVAAARGLVWISEREFWWEFPRGRSLVFLIAYGLGVTGAAVAAVSGLVLLFRSERLRRAVGLGAALAMGWVTLALTSAGFLAFVGAHLDTVAGNDKPVAVSYERELQLIRLKGEITSGAATRFKEVLDAAPDARLVDVSGPGGLIYEAGHIARLIQERDLDTMVSSQCHSACVEIFASGKRRLMHAKAIVGLHSASTFTGGIADSENRAFAERLYKIGVEPRFLMVGTDTPPDGIWINTARQAYLAGLATQVVGQ